MMQRRIKGMTIAQARATCIQHGCRLTHDDGEFRVNLMGGMEATAYYTSDLNDAVATAKVMRTKETKPSNYPS